MQDSPADSALDWPDAICCHESMRCEHLPLYLQNSIREFIEHKDDPLHWDMYADELYDDINSARHDGMISKEEADRLRRECLFEPDEPVF